MTELTELEIRKVQYEAKRQARYDRLLAAADRASREASSLTSQAHEMASIIPFGQPILVGHYSEGRDRRYRARIENKYRKGFELQERANELRSRAESAANNTAISSDDPDATNKLTQKLEAQEAQQELYKAINKAHAAYLKNPASLEKCDLSDGIKNTIRNYKPAYSWEPHPIAPYQLTNLSANIRRIKDRISELERKNQQTTTEKEYPGGIKIVDNVEENRLQIFFPGKPAEAVRDFLKHSGFRWSPNSGAWQAYRNANANYYARQLIEKFYSEGVTPA